MGTQYFSNAGTFLIQTVFGLYILAVMLRFLFQLTRADFYNPVSQFIVKITNPPLRPLRRFVPGIAGVDVPSIVLMLILKLLELLLIITVSGVAPGISGLLVLALADLCHLALQVFLFAIIIQVIISWVAPHAYNPLASLLYSLTEPVLRPARRVLGSVGGLDLSPLIALIALQLISMLLIAPLKDLGLALLSG